MQRWRVRQTMSKTSRAGLYVLGAANRHDEALAAYGVVLALSPERSGRALRGCDLLLSAGDFENGLPLYEVRHHQHKADHADVQRRRGRANRSKQSILVQGEQGLAISFSLPLHP